MGLRFRKSVTLCKGVKLNFGKNSMSISTGVPGFRSTYNFTTGKTTRSIGIPGTGISYVTTTGGKRTQRSSQPTTRASTTSENYETNYTRRDWASSEESRRNVQQSYQNIGEELDAVPCVPDDVFLVDTIAEREPLPLENIKEIHYLSDSVIDWTEMLISDKPEPDCENVEFWHYCHERAYQVLNGDIDTYLEIIQDLNPLDDLLDYGFGFECGTDNANTMVVEFTSRQDEILPPRNTMTAIEYNDLLQDYVCSCAVRVARDIFALLPVSYVIVHAVSDEQTVLSVKFERRIFMKMKFQGTDASNLVCKFSNNMAFNREYGFSPVQQIED